MRMNRHAKFLMETVHYIDNSLGLLHDDEVTDEDEKALLEDIDLVEKRLSLLSERCDDLFLDLDNDG